MKRFLSVLAVTLLCGSAAFTQTIASGSKLYIEPMNGFENYLTAAIQTKKVPVTVVLDKTKADYVVTGSWKESNGGTTGNGSLIRPLHQRTNYSASVSVIDPTSSAVVFAYSSQKSADHDLSKDVAEDWANHLRDEMQGKKKP